MLISLLDTAGTAGTGPRVLHLDFLAAAFRGGCSGGQACHCVLTVLVALGPLGGKSPYHVLLVTWGQTNICEESPFPLLIHL